MLKFLKSKRGQEDPPKKPGLFNKLRQGLSRTRHQLSSGLANLILGKKTIDSDLLDEIESILLRADVGVDVTQTLIDDITGRISRKELASPEALYQALELAMQDILTPCNIPLTIDTEKKPYIILMVGVNGTGKTTTIGKLAKRFQQDNLSVMLAAGDTFRAAAVEQLQAWGQRNDIPVIAQQTGSDSASVIFDAIHAAKARGIDVLIADTAGRLHTQSNLMEELKKINRVIKKHDEHAPHETLLVLDAGTGQNALQQAQQFNDAVQVSGITLTKLDGTAKGGIIFAIAQALKLPIRFIGVGENIEDLQAFNAQQFIDALFDGPSENDSVPESQ